MSAFSSLIKPRAPQQKRPAPRAVEVPVHAFADDWAGKPTQPMRVGLRLVSERDMQMARSEAAKHAWRLHREEHDDENRVDAFNDALVRWVVSCALCKPDDATAPFWDDMQLEVVNGALTSEGVRLLWEEYETLAIDSSPLSRELDDEELPALGMLTADVFDALDPEESRRVRRLLAHCLDTLTEA